MEAKHCKRCEGPLVGDDEVVAGICTACMEELDDRIASEEAAASGLDVAKAKEVIGDVQRMAQRLTRLTRRFGNAKDQAEAVQSTLRLLAGIKEMEANPDLPVSLAFRVTFNLDEQNVVDARIGGLLLPLSVIVEDLLAPIANAGLNGLEVMREEIEEVEDVVTDASLDYDTMVRCPRANPEDLN